MLIRELLPKDWEKIELYMKAGANHKKIAESFGVEPEIFRIWVKQRYGEEYNIICSKFRTTGELLIEAMQFQQALSGNIKMLIWLGKVRLGQREPELLSTIPPAQDTIEKDHIIMGQQHMIEVLKNKLSGLGHNIEIEKEDGNQSQAE